MLNEPDFVQLIDSVQAGDAESFGRLYDEYVGAMFRFVIIKIPHRQQAEDALQETFLKAWRGIRGFTTGGEREFRSWLYRIAANVVNDYYRKRYRSPESVPLDPAFDIPDTAAETSPLSPGDEKVSAALSRLPAPYREVLELRFVQDRSPAETATILGKSNLAVRLLQHRALKRLHDEMH